MDSNQGLGEDLTRPDQEQADRIDEALMLERFSGHDVAAHYMACHGVASDTSLRVLSSQHSRRQPLCRSREQAAVAEQHTESALDEALAEGFPASDPVAISIA
jgi:hypothetical protein